MSLRETVFRDRPIWMNALMLFCAFMALVYCPWDLFIKPVAEDEEVWFGILFHGTWAKVLAVPHWFVYAGMAWGFWHMRSWMHPWAALYWAQVAIGMLVWSLLYKEGMTAILGALVPFAAFALLTRVLWQARPLFEAVEQSRTAPDVP